MAATPDPVSELEGDQETKPRNPRPAFIIKLILEREKVKTIKLRQTTAITYVIRVGKPVRLVQPHPMAVVSLPEVGPGMARQDDGPVRTLVALGLQMIRSLVLPDRNPTGLPGGELPSQTANTSRPVKRR